MDNQDDANVGVSDEVFPDVGMVDVAGGNVEGNDLEDGGPGSGFAEQTVGHAATHAGFSSRTTGSTIGPADVPSTVVEQTVGPTNVPSGPAEQSIGLVDVLFVTADQTVGTPDIPSGPTEQSVGPAKKAHHNRDTVRLNLWQKLMDPYFVPTGSEYI
ncbi:hypothetical protein VNO77_18585 [Canavalia gladiata]|uniref:Uncharacterized protein n=1 Tax=Canavalia gladiata TaxID=3824 RepID=A0AAN9LLT0_CANGL